MSAQPVMRIPPLRQGDHLTPEEFLRRYEAMPEVKKAELINGVVHMPMAVTHEDHGAPHIRINLVLGFYLANTPGVDGGDNSTLTEQVGFNVPQPDGFLRLLFECGGQSRIVDRYLVGAPELIAEVAASSVSYDLHEKREVYRRNRVREYVVWRTEDHAIDWFFLQAGKFQPLKADKNGVFKSKVFPGLWLDAPALFRDDLTAVLAKLLEGISTLKHQRFVKKLAKLKSQK